MLIWPIFDTQCPFWANQGFELAVLGLCPYLEYILFREKKNMYYLS